MATGRVPTTANSPLTAKGDLFTYSTAPARLAVGLDGEQIVANSSTSTGLAWAGNYAAGKNKIINGDFGIWQRGTSFANSGNSAYTADRFMNIFDGTGATRAISQQTFTPGTAPVAGYEGKFFFRFNQTVAGTGSSYNIVQQPIEDVQTFAGQTISISFWAKSDSSRVLGNVDVLQNFNGSSAVSTSATLTSGSATIGSTWQRVTYSVAVPSITGKTIGASSSLNLRIWLPVNSTFTLDFWGVQVEAGSVATAFQTATGTIQGETSACQRYYYLLGSGTNSILASGFALGTTEVQCPAVFPVTMRTAPTLVVTTGTNFYADQFNGKLANTLSLQRASQQTAALIMTATGYVSGAGSYIYTNNASASVAFNSEL